jgi:hypothetical protein
VRLVEARRVTELAILVPTRSRPQNIKPMLDAFWKTGTFDAANVYFIVDADDMYIDQYERIVGMDVAAKLLRMPAWQPLVPKLNTNAVDAAEQHRIVAFLGDDHLPRTPRWAHMLVENHSTQPELIWYGQDGFQNRRLPSWWSMSSEVVRRLGRMVPAPVQHLYCDNAVMKLGERIGRLGYDERILVEHMHPLAGKGKNDEQYVRVNRGQQYERDGNAFRAWLANGIEADAKLLLA